MIIHALKSDSYFQALESENFAFRTQHLEKENALLQEEAVGLRAQVNRDIVKNKAIQIIREHFT